MLDFLSVAPLATILWPFVCFSNNAIYKLLGVFAQLMLFSLQIMCAIINN
jgi:hypothetical protein